MTQSVILIDSLTKCWEWSLPYYCYTWANTMGIIALALITTLILAWWVHNYKLAITEVKHE